jgi:hypothetical protein
VSICVVWLLNFGTLAAFAMVAGKAHAALVLVAIALAPAFVRLALDFRGDNRQ